MDRCRAMRKKRWQSCKVSPRPPNPSNELFFHAHKSSRGRVNRDRKLGALAARPVNDMPDQFVRSAAPVQNIKHWSLRILLQEFVASMLLRFVESFVGIYFQKTQVESMRGGIVRIVSVLTARNYAAFGGIRHIGATPGKRLHCMLGGGTKRSQPNIGFAVVTVRVGSRL